MASTENKMSTPKAPSWKEQGFLPIRYVMCGLTFLGLMFNFILRVNINFSIMAMVKNNEQEALSNKTIIEDDVCGFSQLSHKEKEYEGEFEWDEWAQAQITGSFYWGYGVTQIPGGRMAELFGAHHVINISLALAALLNLLIPIAAKSSIMALIAVRVMLGLAEGMIHPAVSRLFACWVPPEERSFLLSIAHTGGKFGIMITFPIAAALIKTWGWEQTFYVPGAACLVWCCAWFLVVTGKPKQNRWISEPELDYITQSIGSTLTSKKGRTLPLPLPSILTSMPFWAIFVAGLGGSMGFFTLLTYLPLYMKNMLHFDMKDSGAFSGLPYLGFIILSLVIGYAGDLLRQKGLLKTTTLRKIAETIAHTGPAICMIGVTFFTCDRTSTLILFFCAVTCQGGETSGWVVNSLDLAPNFAGTLSGVAGAAATTGGWLAPVLVAALINNQQTFEQWHKVFYIVSSIYIADSLFYIIFGSGEVQKWNYPKDTDTEEVGQLQSKENTIKHQEPTMD